MSTIAVDDRVGSVELIPYFKDYGIQVVKARLDFGDLAFEGFGPGGLSTICIERKRIDDLIQSMQSKRLSGHQLPGMAELYDFIYLIVEGIWRPGEDGQLEINNGRGWSLGHGRTMHYRAVDNYLSTLELKAGVIYRRTSGPRETVATVVDLFRWWQEGWEKHTAHDQVYAPVDNGRGRRMTFVPRKVSLVEKMALQLPGVDSKSKEVAKRFSSVREMASAGESDWLSVPGIGKKTARRIVDVIAGLDR